MTHESRLHVAAREVLAARRAMNGYHATGREVRESAERLDEAMAKLDAAVSEWGK